jgi:hypothetical protein
MYITYSTGLIVSFSSSRRWLNLHSVAIITSIHSRPITWNVVTTRGVRVRLIIRGVMV